MAGDAITTLVNKCQLKAVDPADYPANPLAGIFDPTAFAERVAEIFPDGVCDYTRPGAGVVPTRAWLHYGDAGRVIEGGEPLPQEGTGGRRRRRIGAGVQTPPLRGRFVFPVVNA